MYQLEQKKRNDLDFLNFIYKNKNFTISQVSKALKLTYPTSKRLVDDFLKKKIIVFKTSMSCVDVCSSHIIF